MQLQQRRRDKGAAIAKNSQLIVEAKQSVAEKRMALDKMAAQSAKAKATMATIPGVLPAHRSAHQWS